jgi:four helix bundle protein
MSLLPPVHHVALKLPYYERFDLASQIRRSSKSVPTNIAEGYGKRRSSRHFRSYLENALGSTNETIVHLQIARVLDYISEPQSDSLVAEYRIVARMLIRLMARSQW